MNTEQLYSADFGAVDADASAWRALADALNRSAQQMNSEVLAAIEGGCWRGPAADKACDAISRSRTSLTTSADDAEHVATALARAAQGWRTAQGKLRRACDQAPALGLRIAPDGTAEPLPGREPQPADARELTALAKGALAEAGRIDAELASLLGEAAGVPNPHGMGGASLTIPTGKPPAEVAAWWKGLTPAQREQLIAQHPELIGGLDGVPAEDRHKANLAVLDEKIEDASGDKRKRLEMIRDRIADSRADTDGADDVYLLKLDPSGDGKVILSIGNPDTADDVSVYVPGTTASLWNGFETDLDRAQTMFDAASKKGGNVASVLWLDYDAPDNVPKHAWDPSYADKGGPTLRSFVDSLGSTHQDGKPHTTLVAHSYASLVVSEAARQAPGMNADVIAVGGAGFGLDDSSTNDVAKDLKINGKVYSATGGSDLIRLAHGLEVHGDGPGEFEGTEKLNVSPSTEHTEYWEDEKFLNDAAAVITGDKQAVSGPSFVQKVVDEAWESNAIGDEIFGFGGSVALGLIKAGKNGLDVVEDGIDTAKDFLRRVF